MKTDEELKELESQGKTCTDCNRFDICKTLGEKPYLLCFAYQNTN